MSYFQAFTMPDLATIMSANMDRVVADHTNLPGKFTFSLPFTGGNMQPDSPMGGPGRTYPGSWPGTVGPEAGAGEGPGGAADDRPH